MKRIIGLLRFVSSIIFALLFWGCTQQTPSVTNREEAHERQQPTTVFPIPGNPVPEALAQVIQDSSVLDEILDFEKYVLLEETEASFLKEVSQVIELDGFWFVLDFWEGRVLQYDKNGAFIRMVGAHGMGPGEYRRPINIIRCPQGIAIIARARILVFDTNGKWVQTLKQSPSGNVAFQSQTVIWDNPNMIYLFDYPMQEPHSPWHAAAELNEKGLWEIAFGFGRRHEGIEVASRKGNWGWLFTCAGVFDDRIWVGSPYECSLEVYDSMGRFLGRPEAFHENGVSLNDFSGDVPFDLEKMKKIMVSRVINKSLLGQGKLVFRLLANPINAYSYDIFDTHGRVLGKNISPGKGGLLLLDSYNGNLIGVKTLLNGQPPNKLNLRLFRTRAEFEAAQSVGLNLKSENGRHFLWIGRLPVSDGAIH